MLRPAITHIQYEQANEHTLLQKEIIEHLTEVALEFKKLCDAEQQEKDSLSKQVDTLKQEKNKIK